MKIRIYRNGGLIESVALAPDTGDLKMEIHVHPDEWEVVEVNDQGEEILDPEKV